MPVALLQVKKGRTPRSLVRCLFHYFARCLSRYFARGFARQVIVWAVTCAFLAIANWLTSPHYWWVLWVIGGWGLQLLIAFALYLFDGEENETTQHH